MSPWLTGILSFCVVTGCTTLTPWRRLNPSVQLEPIFAACAAQRVSTPLSWTETVRCGNERVQRLLADSNSRYAGLIEAGLAARLTLARQIDAGSLPETEGQGKLAALDAQLQALPGSTMELLRLTVDTNP